MKIAKELGYLKLLDGEKLMRDSRLIFGRRVGCVSR